MMCAPHFAHAQKIAVSSNVLTWVNFGTINADASLSVSRHLTCHAGVNVNPWKFTSPTFMDLKNNQYGGFLGVRYWPWHVYSEWWLGAKLQYKYFDQKGLLSSAQTKGSAFGPGISGGYTIMLSEHVNLDLGLGIWGGGLLMKEQDPRAFFFLDNVIVAFEYIF